MLWTVIIFDADIINETNKQNKAKLGSYSSENAQNKSIERYAYVHKIKLDKIKQTKKGWTIKKMYKEIAAAKYTQRNRLISS